MIGPQNEAAPPVYDLYAVSHHSGGLGGGHYTATCKNFLNNKWYVYTNNMILYAPAFYVLFGNLQLYMCTMITLRYLWFVLVFVVLIFGTQYYVFVVCVLN